MNGHSDALKLIIEFEGFRDKAYPDPATGGDPWTIGYGFTRVNGHPVVPGQSLSRPEADQLLSTMVGDCANHLSRTIPFWTEMSGKQQSCLLSFAWNLGQDFYGNESDFHTITGPRFPMRCCSIACPELPSIRGCCVGAKPKLTSGARAWPLRQLGSMPAVPSVRSPLAACLALMR
jgi:GH24 family phage-related lysozyme (muramidase)